MEDPRYYVAIAPVPPWDMAKDAKLKARSLNQYNLGSPTRYEMFKNNYTRRLRQMSSQGFMSSPGKPYQPIGSLVLDPKDLVRTTLGQKKADDSTKSLRRKSVREDILIPQTPRSARFQRPATAPIMSARALAIKRKTLQNLHNIPDCLNVVENTKNSVKMGHSLFDALESRPSKQITQSTEPNCGPVMRKQSIDHVAMQPGPKSLPVPKWLINIGMKPTVTIAADNQLHSESYSSMESASQISQSWGEKKTYFLWRQLCALHWLIETCRERQGLKDIPSDKEIVPLAKCWDEVYPGGRTIPKTVSTDAKLERNTSSSSLHLPSRSTSVSTVFGGRISPKGFNSPSTHYRSAVNSRDTLQSKETVSNHETPRSTTPAPTIVLPDNTTHDEETIRGNPFDDAEMSNYHNNLVKLLDTVKESVDKEMQFRKKVADDAAEKKQRLRSPVYKWALGPYPKTPKGVLTVTIPSSSSGILQEKSQPITAALRRPMIRPHTAGPRLKHAGRRESYRPDSAIPANTSSKQEKMGPRRPKSSPPKLRLNRATFSSNQREETMVKLREQFQEVYDMKALRLHQSLSELQRSRIDRMEKKFEAFDSCQLSIDRDLKTMREATQSENGGSRCMSRLDSVVMASSECEWFEKLVNMTSIHEADDKPCKVVLEDLRVSAAKFMGWQEDIGCNRRKKNVNIMDHQITMETFTKVLRELRSFEILAPDVSSAIEFMKNEIVKAPDEQFQDVIKKLV